MNYSHPRPGTQPDGLAVNAPAVGRWPCARPRRNVLLWPEPLRASAGAFGSPLSARLLPGVTDHLAPTILSVRSGASRTPLMWAGRG